MTERMTLKNSSTEDGMHPNTFQEQFCFQSLVGELRQELISFSVVNIILSTTAFLGNFLILVALHKESSLHPPSKLLYRCLAASDLLVGVVSQPLFAAYWMSLVHEEWNLCRNLYDTVHIAGFALCLVSLFTSTAISVDRLLALSLRLRYRQIVTLKRVRIIVAALWLVSGFAGLFYILDPRISFWLGQILTPSCLLISIASYAKIFCNLTHHHALVQDQQASQSNALNIARYKKAVYSAIWVQLALAVCFLPYNIQANVINHSQIYSSHFIVIWGITVVLFFFKSSLNPFLYCWKITGVRKAVKQTITQELCCPRG